MHAAVRRTLAAATFDAIHVDHLPMVTFVPSCDGEGPAVVLDQHNVEHRILERLAASADTRPHVRSVAQAEAARMRRAERLACRRADRILAVSEDDAGALRTLAGPEAADRVRVTPIGVDTAFFQPCTNRPDRSPNDCRTMLTVGTMYWPPNVDGVRWFHREVLPRIRERLAAGGAPDRPLRFVIAGTRPNRVIRALAGPSVEVTGTVPDVRPLMGTADAFVAPLRFGSGVRVKILNALAMGLPIVSTSIGAEGLDVTHGENILLADSAEDFAEAVANVLTEPELARRLGTAARDLAVRRYNWETAGWTLLHTYEELLGPSATVSVAS
jgi:glycosyltransferase involved in cell wall biosynthesis